MTNIAERFSVEGSVALVTGASRGIGAAIADDLGAAGATVIGTATSESGAEAISQRFAAAGIKGRGAVLDVADRDAATALVKDIAANEGAVDIQRVQPAGKREMDVAEFLRGHAVPVGTMLSGQ